MSGKGKQAGAVPSPCRDVCRPSADRTICMGCGRLREEIARWRSASPKAQRAIVQRAAVRLAELQRGEGDA